MRVFKEKVVTAWKLTLPAILLSLLLEFSAGIFLGKYFEKLMLHYPLILVVLPGLMGLRGNIFGALSSRFTSALYLGEIEPKLKDRKVLEIILTGVSLSLLPVAILWLVGVVKLGLDNAIVVFAILLASTIFVSMVLGLTAASVTIIPFRREIDPDAIATPVVTSVADLLTIPTLILFVLLFETHEGVFLFALIFFLVLFGVMGVKYKISKKIFFELSAVLIVLAAVSSISGALLETFSREIHESLIFSILYPAIIGSLGNFGGVVGARTSTKLHIGEVERFFEKETLLDILALTTLTLPLASIMYSSGVLVAYFIFGKVPGVYYFFFPFYMLTALFVMLLGNFISVAFHKFGFDPDNVTVPAITTLADLIGTALTITLSLLF